MDRTTVVNFIVSSIADILEQTSPHDHLTISEDTILFGRDGLLSSLMLVELMLALEDFCNEHGIDFVWTNDSTMSERRSVYRTVASLADFVLSLPDTQPADDTMES